MFDLLKKFNLLFRLCGVAFIVIAVHGFLKGNIDIGLVYLAFGSVLVMATGKKKSDEEDNNNAQHYG